MGEARKGKIARLPRLLRDEVCQRLSDGDTGAEICTWMNKLPAVRKVLDKAFKGEDINEQNLSAWRMGGYEEWRADQCRVENIKRLSDFSARIAQAAGTSLSAGACAIAAGRVQNILEGLADEDLAQIIPALKMLSDTEINRAKEKNDRLKLAQNERALEQKERDLRLRENLAAGNVLKACEEKRAQKIANSDISYSDKIAQMRDLIFGKD